MNLKWITHIRHLSEKLGFWIQIREHSGQWLSATIGWLLEGALIWLALAWFTSVQVSGGAASKLSQMLDFDGGKGTVWIISC